MSFSVLISPEPIPGLRTSLLPRRCGERMRISRRARADEQLGADLRVRLPVARHAGDLSLLWREDVAGLYCSLGCALTRGHELATSALSEPLGPYAAEHFVGGSELLARINAPVLAT